jgi:hypothetical protein
MTTGYVCHSGLPQLMQVLLPFRPLLALSSLLRGRRRNAAYPEQQLPGVPHELGFPQQPPEPGSASL